MKKLILAFCILAGCAPRPQPIIQQVYCLTPDQYTALVNAKPAKIGQTLTGDARKDVKIEGTQNILLMQYADGLLKVLGNCVSGK